jgi:hypothetical protein
LKSNNKYYDRPAITLHLNFSEGYDIYVEGNACKGGTVDISQCISDEDCEGGCTGHINLTETDTETLNQIDAIILARIQSDIEHFNREFKKFGLTLNQDSVPIQFIKEL